MGDYNSWKGVDVAFTRKLNAFLKVKTYCLPLDRSKYYLKMFRLSLFLFVLIMSLSSCSDPGCDGTMLTDELTRFMLKNSFGDNLIAAWGARYASDSVKVRNTRGELITNAQPSGIISFYLVSNPDPPIETLISDTVYLELPPWQGNQNKDIDTIHYKYILDEHDCPEIFYSWVKVGFNGSIIFEGDYEPSLQVDLIKE